MRFGLALALIAVCAVLPACSKRTTTVPTANGPVTVTQDNGSKNVSYQSKEGKVVLGQNAVDPASLGLPIYPGATPSEGGSLAADTNRGSAKVVTLQTKDSFDKVYAFYHTNMPAGSEKSKMSMAGSSMASFQIGNEAAKMQKSVSIVGSGNSVTITLIVGTKP